MEGPVSDCHSGNVSWPTLAGLPPTGSSQSSQLSGPLCSLLLLPTSQRSQRPEAPHPTPHTHSLNPIPLQDYIHSTHGKEMDLLRTTVKVPGKRPPRAISAFGPSASINGLVKDMSTVQMGEGPGKWGPCQVGGEGDRDRGKGWGREEGVGAALAVWGWGLIERGLDRLTDPSPSPSPSHRSYYSYAQPQPQPQLPAASARPDI